MLFILGFIFGSFIFEPLIINLIYFKNIDLFIDLFLTKKNELKLEKYYAHYFKEVSNENKEI